MSDDKTAGGDRAGLVNTAGIRIWGQIATGSQSIITFLVVAVFVFLTGDKTLIGAVLGYAAGNANTVINYFFGSSASSQAKDEKLVPRP